MTSIAVISGGAKEKWFGTSNFFLALAFFIAPLAIYFAGKLLQKTGIAKDKNNILFNRRKGVIVLPRKKLPPLELAFDEFDPYLGSSVNPSGSMDWHLILGNRYNGWFVQHPEGHGDNDRWRVYLDWEFLQHYMDISKPLPDIPSMEPFRHNDPVTAAYDKQHNRPPRYWRDMDLKTAGQMNSASAKAAANYPWGLTREQALAQGWQPSGVGQGDWRKE